MALFLTAGCTSAPAPEPSSTDPEERTPVRVLSADDVAAGAILRFTDVVAAEGLQVSDRGQHLMDEGKALVGLLTSDRPILHPNGTVEVHEGWLEAMDDYRAGQTDPRLSRDLREFEALVVFGMYDPESRRHETLRSRYLRAPAPAPPTGPRPAAAGDVPEDAQTEVHFGDDDDATGDDGGWTGDDDDDTGDDDDSTGDDDDDTGDDDDSTGDDDDDTGDDDDSTEPAAHCEAECYLIFVKTTVDSGTPYVTTPTTNCEPGYHDSEPTNLSAGCTGGTWGSYQTQHEGLRGARWSGCKQEGTVRVRCEWSDTDTNGPCADQSCWIQGYDNGKVELEVTANAEYEALTFFERNYGYGKAAGEVSASLWNEAKSDEVGTTIHAHTASGGLSCTVTSDPSFGCNVQLNFDATVDTSCDGPSFGFNCAMQTGDDSVSQDYEGTIVTAPKDRQISFPSDTVSVGTKRVEASGVARAHNDRRLAFEVPDPNCALPNQWNILGADSTSSAVSTLDVILNDVDDSDPNDTEGPGSPGCYMRVSSGDSQTDIDESLWDGRPSDWKPTANQTLHLSCGETLLLP